ncbi:phosphate signaling complex protein PhoU [Solitalea koreensis]|uniref:Phosphate-specific transport system accessory protein PhoU n=1 Tax=Solitalea koreensis TaxID=543615 RepID=A0A521APE2_9SPHI|nr:phosphate signaling complex protein PhoU [Solitalea koreensis]SMO36672.1 phosphate uptake regulator, PhoU [Solitalea koreensis]
MTHLEEELQKLYLQMIDMANLVTGQISKCLSAMLEADQDLAREVIFNEKRVNAYELKIDKDCENIFTLLNPFAQDMRFVFATLKINSNFERIGDNAEGISHYVLLADKGFDKSLLKFCRFEEMVVTVNEMLSDVTKAYIDKDPKHARRVFQKDSILDEINKAATDLLANYIKENPGNIMQALYLLTIIRKVERVGDHITNIAEEIIFYMEAKVLKHGKKSHFFEEMDKPE